jgi:hypothetical protein
MFVRAVWLKRDRPEVRTGLVPAAQPRGGANALGVSGAGFRKMARGLFDR